MRSMNRIASLTVAMIAVTSVVGRAQAQATLPPLAPAATLKLPTIVQETLPNGLRLVVLEDHQQPALWLRLALPAGANRDPKDKVGLATLVAAQLDKGTTTRTESQIADIVDGLGASLGAATDDDYLTVSASGLSGYRETLFDLLADITLHSTFPEAELNRYKTRTLSSIASDLASASTAAEAALNRTLYGAHPYGNFSQGTPQTIPGITQADVKAFQTTYFAPNGATLFIVGDITPVQAREQVTKYFGSWAKKDVPAPPAAPDVTVRSAGDGKLRIVVVDRPGAAQTEIRIGQLTPGYADAGRIPTRVTTVLLGGGFESRLMKEIRVKRGLTYGVSSQNGRNKQAGIFEVSTFTKNASTGEVIKLALDELRKLQMTPPETAELEERKTLLTGSFALGVATPPGLLGRLIPAVLYGNGPSDLTTYTQTVIALTPADIQRVLKALPTDNNTVVLVGDAKEIQAQLTELGTVTVVPKDALDLNSPTLGAKP